MAVLAHPAAPIHAVLVRLAALGHLLGSLVLGSVKHFLAGLLPYILGLIRHLDVLPPLLCGHIRL